MFKLAAVLGLVAGGAGYAVYEYTDLFGNRDTASTCSLKPDCLKTIEVAAAPSCCQQSADSTEPVASCCATPSRATAIVKAGGDGEACCAAGCCAAKTTPVSAKLAACCQNPAVGWALFACEVCAERSSASAAVAGTAAVIGVK